MVPLLPRRGREAVAEPPLRWFYRLGGCVVGFLEAYENGAPPRTFNSLFLAAVRAASQLCRGAGRFTSACNPFGSATDGVERRDRIWRLSCSFLSGVFPPSTERKFALGCAHKLAQRFARQAADQRGLRFKHWVRDHEGGGRGRCTNLASAGNR